MTQTSGTSSTPFRVIIVGAGIAGLSLAHALQLANIDHVILEKYDKVKSIKGAALTIYPNAERIFDQFGILSNMLSSTAPVAAEYQRWPDGSILGSRSTLDRFRIM
jgi:FAD dependent monooxygenase